MNRTSGWISSPGSLSMPDQAASITSTKTGRGGSRNRSPSVSGKSCHRIQTSKIESSSFSRKSAGPPASAPSTPYWPGREAHRPRSSTRFSSPSTTSARSKATRGSPSRLSISETPTGHTPQPRASVAQPWGRGASEPALKGPHILPPGRSRLDVCGPFRAWILVGGLTQGYAALALGCGVGPLRGQDFGREARVGFEGRPRARQETRTEFTGSCTSCPKWRFHARQNWHPVRDWAMRRAEWNRTAR